MTGIPAGWYSNPDNDVEIRYWDGSQWTDQVGPKPGAPAAEGPDSAPQKRKRRVPLWVAITAGVAGLLLGGTGSLAGADAQRIDELEQELASAQSESEKALQALEQVEDDFSEERASLILEVEEATEEAEKAAKEIEKALQAVEQAEQTAEEANERASAAEAAAEEAPLSLVDTPTGTSDTTSSVYYKNCTAARAAGAAPLYAGQPGYASHLDRDGDGVACE